MRAAECILRRVRTEPGLKTSTSAHEGPKSTCCDGLQHNPAHCKAIGVHMKSYILQTHVGYGAVQDPSSIDLILLVKENQARGHKKEASIRLCSCWYLVGRRLWISLR